MGRARVWRALFATALVVSGGIALQLGVAAWVVAIAVLGTLGIWGLAMLGGPPEISQRVFAELGVSHGRDYHVLHRSAPSYRYVDFFRAASAWAEDLPHAVLDLDSAQMLGVILSGHLGPNEPHKAQSAPSEAFAVGPDENEYLPTARFWVSRSGVCVRLRLLPHGGGCLLEVGTPDAARSVEVIDEIVEGSTTHSIFRGAVVLADTSVRIMDHDDYALATASGPLSLSFARLAPVGGEDIVLDDEVWKVLRRNIVDLQNQGERLAKHGLPLNRGVLFYGPPGTGKTYACRHLFGQLDGSTVLIASGQALLKVREVFELARSLCPSLVVLEDVDLVFSKREHNPYGGTLGSLLDELDGLKPEEHVGVILTTNAIERVEAAIKDRPGRISQAVYFGAPNADLRRRYLARYLRDRPMERVDLERLVELSSGATQAFLKEWVHRAVQIAAERSSGQLRLDTACFEDAMAEMRRFAEGAERIIGFGSNDDPRRRN